MGKAARKFKKGIASFYIVAFSTLILVIVVSSFAAVVISEIARTSNDDLSQSAYDAALAGIEDAKLAYNNYQACLKKGFGEADKKPDGNAVDCKDIIWLMRHPDCDMVAKILGRREKYDEGNDANNEVVISETQSGSSNMNQAYTCVKISTKVSSYRASLSSSNTYKVIRVKGLEGVKASGVKSILLSWYSVGDGKYNYGNYKDGAWYGGVVFRPRGATEAAVPPTIALELIQAANSFTMEQLNGQTIVQVVDGKTTYMTDRATLYLVPTESGKGINEVSSSDVASTNNLIKNLPKVVNCNDTGEFACSVAIDLPEPIGVSPDNPRNDDAFMFVVSLPYGTPDTDFEIKFCDSDGCRISGDEESSIGSGGFVELNNMQLSIDSTGRANDLFRRVEVRMEPGDAGFSYPLYAIEATEGSGGSGSIEKDLTITSEYDLK